MAKTEQDKPAEKAKASTVTMDLTDARVYKGTAYGPGTGIEVPEKAAKRWSHEDEKAPTKKGAK